MTNPLHLPARPDAPIACDMSTASDTPDERLAEYRELFSRALVRRERGEHRVVVAFRADDGVREQVDSLARREADCCPFADYRVETVGDEVVYAITTSVDEMLDEFYELTNADSQTSGAFQRMQTSFVVSDVGSST
jgi:hypothetical protein